MSGVLCSASCAAGRPCSGITGPGAALCALFVCWAAAAGGRKGAIGSERVELGRGASDGMTREAAVETVVATVVMCKSFILMVVYECCGVVTRAVCSKDIAVVC